MNRSKLFEWLLDNDCPWDFDYDYSNLDNVFGKKGSFDKCVLVFTEKQEQQK